MGVTSLVLVSSQYTALLSGSAPSTRQHSNFPSPRSGCAVTEKEREQLLCRAVFSGLDVAKKVMASSRPSAFDPLCAFRGAKRYHNTVLAAPGDIGSSDEEEDRQEEENPP
jgi:hypothetical protein